MSETDLPTSGTDAEEDPVDLTDGSADPDTITGAGEGVQDLTVRQSASGCFLSLAAFFGHCLLTGIWIQFLVGLVLRLTIRDRYPGLAIIFYASPMIVLAIEGLILALRARWCGQKKLSIGLVVLAVACASAWQYQTHYSHPVAERSQESIRVLFWNVAYVKAGWPALIAEIKKQDADVIGLVEVSGGWSWVMRDLAKEFPDYHVQFVYHGIILVRGSIERIQHGSLDRRGDYALARLKMDSGPQLNLALIDIYAQPWLPRSQALGSLQTVLSERRDPAIPLLLMGDFNTPPESCFLDFLRTDSVEAFESAGNGYHVTWPVSLPLLALDQIWLSGGEFSECRLIDTPHSDHRMVTAEFSLE